MSIVKVVSVRAGGWFSTVTTDFGPPKGNKSHFILSARACEQSKFELAARHGKRRARSDEYVDQECRDDRISKMKGYSAEENEEVNCLG